MTDMETYLHATIKDIRDVLMTKGLSSDVDFAIAALCDKADRLYQKQRNQEMRDREIQGPGGIHHGG